MRRGKQIFTTVLALTLYAIFRLWFNTIGASKQAVLAVKQLSDDPSVYQGARMGANTGLIIGLATIALVITIIITWKKEIADMFKHIKYSLGALALLVVFGVMLTGCAGPFQKEEIETIQPNETAFLIPLEGGTDQQAQLQSVEYLKSKQVATKRITIPTRSRQLGRGWWNYEWIPTMTVIKVDRTPISRMWSPGADQDSNGKDEGFRVESKESVGFTVGIAATGIIYEEDAAQFLYYFSNKPLTTVMDENVYNYVQQQLFEEFAKLPVMQAAEQKNEVLAQVHDDTVAYFKIKGLTIESLGGQGGLVFDDDKIQVAIDSILVAEQAEEVATKEQAAVRVKNETARFTAENDAKIAAIKAQGEADSALIRAKAEAEAIRMKGQALSAAPGFTAQTIAEHSNGQVPSTLIVTSENAGNLPFIWQLPAATTTVTK